jgi:hypothetical protein
MAMKKKMQRFGLEIRSYAGRDGTTYIVFRTSGGSFHAFAEVEAKQAARECGVKREGTTRQMWESLWSIGQTAATTG